MKIQVFGTSCSRCKTLTARVEGAIRSRRRGDHPITMLQLMASDFFTICKTQRVSKFAEMVFQIH